MKWCYYYNVSTGGFSSSVLLRLGVVRVPEVARVEHVAELDPHRPRVLDVVVEDEAGVEPLGVLEALAAELGGPDVPEAVHVGVVRVEERVAPRRAEEAHVVGAVGFVVLADDAAGAAVGALPADPDVQGGVRHPLQRALAVGVPRHLAAQLLA